VERLPVAYSIDMSTETEIAIDDPRAADVRELIRSHLEFARACTPPENAHALDHDGLLDPDVTLFSCRRDGALLAIGALKHLDSTHCELKSMHTARTARGQGIGRALLDRLIEVARERGYRRVSLETGTMQEFAPARSLYASAGFVDCDPFGAYRGSPYNAFMTLALTASESSSSARRR